jgi:hypothetical protein
VHNGPQRRVDLFEEHGVSGGSGQADLFQLLGQAA